VSQIGMAELSYQSIRTANQAREAVRNILYIVLLPMKTQSLCVFNIISFVPNSFRIKPAIKSI